MREMNNDQFDIKKLPNQNIFLIGLMGAGKTTLGKLIAKKLNLSFFDSDLEIESHLGVSITQIFKLEGESSFRRWEEKFINSLTNRHGIVLATGGGVILSDENRKHLKTRGLVIYLHAMADVLYTRIHQSQNRPLLTGSTNMLETLNKLYLERDASYRECAHFVIETNKLPMGQLIDQILNLIIMRNESLLCKKF